MEIVAASDRRAAASLSLSAFEFPLPPELIAQVPAERRDAARLLGLDRRSGAITHTMVSALPELLRTGDLLVVNDTRVIPARLFGRVASGGAIELLLIRPTVGTQVPIPATGGEQTWLCLGKPAKRLRGGTTLILAGGSRAAVTTVHGDGRYSVTFEDGADVRALLDRHGEIPLPPYIRRPDGPLPLDDERYQTIFAATRGAIAAPTAGLHFTDGLVRALQARGVGLARLTLHVGPGTFLPVRVEDISAHVMDPEWCAIPAETAAAIDATKRAGGRVVAVGTTTTRGLESAATADGRVEAGAGWADGFIVPGHRFRVVDALFTNFHLPGSTLLLLVSAFAGREHVLRAYTDAIERRYRFYSYGDAMLLQ